MISPKIISILLLAIAVSSCKSELSNGEVTSISLIGANIEVFQDISNKNENYVIISLHDNNSTVISNDSIKIIVNDSVLNLHRKQALYYNDISNYNISNVAVDDLYTIEIQLTNGSKHLLGSIKVLPEENTDNIITNEKGDLNNNTVIEWNNLRTIDQLVISPSVILKNSEENITNYDYRPETTKKIDKKGSFTYYKSDYEDSKSNISSLNFTFSTIKQGKLNPEILSSSSISISTTFEKSVRFYD